MSNIQNTLFIGKVFHYYKSCSSTNEAAKEILTKSRPSEGTVIMSDFQHAGKGQYGNAWRSAPKENFLGSVLLYPSFLQAGESFYLNIAISLAIAGTINSLTKPYGINAQIKWPNDILIKQKKVAGILIENQLEKSHIRSSIVGIGININQVSFPEVPTAISIKQITQKTTSILSFSNMLFSTLEACYLQLKNRHFDSLKNVYLNQLYGHNTWIRLQKGASVFEGKITDVDKNGNIIVSLKNGLVHTYRFKEVEFILDC